MSQRKYLIAGNWKMNKTIAEAVALAEDLVVEIGTQTDVSTVICPPFTALAPLVPVVENSNIALGAQNFYPEASGAFTGEISASMLRDLFVNYVIVGHSERRTLLCESDTFINQKVLSAFNANLRPILCLGESLEEHQAGRTLQILRSQIDKGLDNVEPAQAERIVIAYEPIWAIGTGNSATPEIAQETHVGIRKCLKEHFGLGVASKIMILYGGSMKPENAEQLLKQPDIDGGLIGGASLKAKSFLKLIKTALKLTQTPNEVPTNL